MLGNSNAEKQCAKTPRSTHPDQVHRSTIHQAVTYSTQRTKKVRFNGVQRRKKTQDHQPEESACLQPLQLLKAPLSNGLVSCSSSLPIPGWTCSGVRARHARFPPPRCRPRCGESPPRSMLTSFFLLLLLQRTSRWLSTSCRPSPWQQCHAGWLEIACNCRSLRLALRAARCRAATALPTQPKKTEPITHHPMSSSHHSVERGVLRSHSFSLPSALRFHFCSPDPRQLALPRHRRYSPGFK